MTQLCGLRRSIMPEHPGFVRRTRPAQFRCTVRPSCLQHQQGEWVQQLAHGGEVARRPTLRVASLPKSASSTGLPSELESRTQVATAEQYSGQPASMQHEMAETREGTSAGGLFAQWDALPGKYRTVAATSLSFVICNMDKVNISVAIIPMAQDFGWSSTVSGIVQSSFFYGYMLSQIPGGYLASLYGGRRVLPAGVALWSLATAAVPVLAGTMPGLMLCRAAVGLGEAAAPSSATDIVARSVETSERSRAISFIFGGLHVGTLLGLVVAPYVIEHFGWPAVFYLFGGIGMVWSLWWEQVMAGIAVEEPELAAALVPGGQPGKVGAAQGAAAGAAKEAVPWRAFLRNRPLQALAYTHFCNNWFHYTILSWIPTYFTSTLSLDLTRAAQVSMLPPVAAIAVSAIAGPTADALLSKGVPVATVRKAAQCVAFLCPAALLLAASVVDADPGNGVALVGLIAGALGLASFSLPGLYCNHPDLSPRYAPVLLGITNTAGALPGIIGVACTGVIYDLTSSWPLALFAPSIFFFITGSAAFVLYGNADLQDFASNNQPFRIEVHLRRALRKLGLQKRSGQSGVGGPAASLQQFITKLKGGMGQD